MHLFDRIRDKRSQLIESYSRQCVCESDRQRDRVVMEAADVVVHTQMYLKDTFSKHSSDQPKQQQTLPKLLRG